MTGKEALERALGYYILSNAGTKYDIERKVELAKGYLKELQCMDSVTKEWINDKDSILSRVIRHRHTCLDRTIKEALPDYDMSAEREERRILVEIAKLFKHLPELPL